VEYSKELKAVLFFMLIGWCFGLSFRVMFEYFSGNPVYIANEFDILFDWFGLFLLALINLLISLS
jgi:hypothetical protein